MKFGVGIIGATGFIGTPYRSDLREATDEARIVPLCARRRGPLEAAGREDGATLLTDDWRQVVEHPDVNLVLVATPDALHHEAVMASAQLGKHTFCEKPVGVDAREAHEMWSAYRDAGLGHFVPYWTRYMELFARARAIAHKGTLGDIRAVVYRWHNPRPASIPFTWRDDANLSSSGSIGDVGSHAYDLIRWTLGREADRVLTHADVITPAKPDLGDVNLTEAVDWGLAHATGEAPKLRKGTAFDYANIAIEFPGGTVASIILSHSPFLRKGLAPELELHGTTASLAIDRLTGNVTVAYPEADPQVLETVADRGPGNRFVRHVFPALRERAAGQPSEHPGLDDGWRVQIFADAAALSARRGGWVDLSEVEEAGR